MGALNYNLQKMNHPDSNRRAKLLDMNFDCDTLEQVKKEVELLRELRPNLNRYVYHTSLNFAVEDEAFLSKQFQKQCAQEMKEHCTGKTPKFVILEKMNLFCFVKSFRHQVMQRLNYGMHRKERVCQHYEHIK